MDFGLRAGGGSPKSSMGRSKEWILELAARTVFRKFDHLECSDHHQIFRTWSTREMHRFREFEGHLTIFSHVLVYFSSWGDSKIPCKGLKNEFSNFTRTETRFDQPEPKMHQNMRKNCRMIFKLSESMQLVSTPSSENLVMIRQL